jgi:transcriptional regulator NrdR family protein
MVCIYCGSKTSITNSRPQKRLNRTWRRRQCETCQAVFTSVEAADLAAGLVVSHSHSPVEPFSRDKLFVSLYRALGHRKTAVSDAGALSDTIVAKLLHGEAQASISPADIVQTAHQTLLHFDQAAAVQYQAYHHA